MKAARSVTLSKIPSLTLIQVETTANFGSAIIATPDSTLGGMDPELLDASISTWPCLAGPCQVARKISQSKVGSATVFITNIGFSETEKSLPIRCVNMVSFGSSA